MNRERNDTGLDRQINNLAGSLREKGVQPERDLWPDIEAAIGKVEQNAAAVRGGQPGSGRPALWRVAAVAASIALLLGIGYIGMNGDNGLDKNQATRMSDLELASAEIDPASIQGLDTTLQDLNAALRQDPENHHLSRLVLLVHKSRADVMRQDARQWRR
jgi:hypothetical protein